MLTQKNIRKKFWASTYAPYGESFEVPEWVLCYAKIYRVKKYREVLLLSPR